MRNRSASPRLALLFCISLTAAACAGEAPARTAVDEAPARTEDIHLQPAPPAEPENHLIEGRVPNRSTLASILYDHGLDSNQAARVIDAVRLVFDPRRFRVGNAYRLELGPDGAPRSFEYEVDRDRFLHVGAAAASSGDFRARLVPYEKERVEQALRGFINREHTSLAAALSGAGEQELLAIELADVLAGEIDFNTELQPGDEFSALVEKYFRDGEFNGYGHVMAVDFINEGRRVQAFRFTVPGDPEALYYNEQGESLKRQFLRSPFKFEPRVTSRFSRRRLHPILGTYRPHLGVDYGAPTGTPVVAVATGTVVSAGRSRASGNMVRLRHTNGYETYYLHLSAFARGVRPGVRILQGQTIGRVGATGLATGPHLDYRMSKNGKFVDPLLEHRNLPPGVPVPQRHLAAFRETRERLLERMWAGNARAD